MKNYSPTHFSPLTLQHKSVLPLTYFMFTEFKDSKTKKSKTKKPTDGENETEGADDDVEFVEESMDDE